MLLACCAGLWAVSLGAAAGDEPGPWTSLFNGKDLAGWNVQCAPQDRAKTFWTVADGAIVCDSMGRPDHNYVWLMTDREFGDFELTLKFQAYRDSPGNSGVQFRSRFDPTAPGGGRLDGPQVDIHPPALMNWRTGLIYDETRGESRWIFPSLKNAQMDPKFKPEHSTFRYADESANWNDLTLICRGLHVKTIVNGDVRTDWDGAGVLDNAAHQEHHVGRTGHIALQLHSGDQLRIRFKEIRIRKVGSEQSSSRYEDYGFCGRESPAAPACAHGAGARPRPQGAGTSRWAIPRC